jgi:two-component system, NarL family, sensor kinase
MRDAVSPNAASLLADLLAEITAAPPLQQLLERALDAACQLAHADTGAVGLYDAATDTMRITAVRHAMPAPFQQEFVRGDGLAGHIIATGQAYHGRYGDLPKPLVAALRDHTSLGLPIRWQDRLLGHLALSVEPPRKFRSADVELVNLIPPIIAIAIGHAQRHDEELRGRRRFELIAHITADIHHHNQDLEALLQRAADAIHEMLQFPNVDIPLIDPADPQTLIVRVRGGDYKHRIQREDRLPVHQGIMGAAVRERLTQLVNDVRTDPRYVCPPGVAPAQAELAIPLRLADRVLGVLNIESDRAFSDLDRRSLEVVADYLAVAIDNARLFAQAGSAAVLDERARLARELHDNVTQILASMNLLSQTLAATWKRNPAEGEQRVARLHQLAQTAFAEMRMLLRQLAPAEPENYHTVSRKSRVLVGLENLRTHALPGALTKLLGTIVPENIAVASSFAAYVPQKLEHEEALYRVCQEALSNSLRHASAKRLRVEAAVTGEHAVLRVSDDGRGLDTDFRPGIGLGSMRTRIETLRGSFRIGSNNPRGTLIEARLPRADREIAPDQSRE